ncbi:MAG: protein kinase [Clostridiales Family XIII bacterium]|jgi:serine/threonine-protein kinase|nr:protein kinase [Clostridiales Family XIII bacterium]
MGYKILAGRYEIHDKIGDGGMAVVYKARDKLLNRMVAIKVLRPEYVKDASFVDSFRRESRAAASLSHPNIVNIYDVGKEGNIYYIVMELVDGQTLADVIQREGPMDFRRVISISKQIASALSLAHRNNIVHRDIKPQNILMTSDGNAKITDFGIARAVTDSTTVSDNNTVIGSVHYFSPEQGRGQYVDEKSDIYSLGIVIYEMLTGKVPFDADNPVAIAVMHMNDRMVPPSKLVSGIPPGLEQIIIKATEKYQVNRFKTADEMYQALDRVDYVTGRITDPAIAAAVRQSTYYDDKNGRKGDGASDEYDDDADGADGDEAAQSGDDYGEYDDEQGYEDYGLQKSAGAGDDASFDEADDDASAGEDEYDDDYTAEEGAVGVAAGRSSRSNKNGKGNKFKTTDKKNKKAKKPKDKDKHKKYKILAILLAVVLAAALAYPAYLGVNKLIGLFQQEEESGIKVPDVKGLTEEEAAAELKKLGITMVKGEPVYSEDVVPGLIAAQAPEKGERTDDTNTVMVGISLGSEEDDVAPEEPDEQPAEDNPEDVSETETTPDVTGKNKEDAEYTITQFGFEVGAIKYEDSEKPIDQVIAQSPKGGKSAVTGSKIDITISQGPKAVEVKMPNLVGLTKAKAKAALKKVNLVLDSAKEEYSDEYKKGTVIWQQYKKGTKLSEGQSVDIKISKGSKAPDKPVEPADKTSTVNINIDFSEAPADVFTLTVVLVNADGSQMNVVKGKECFRGSGSEIVPVKGTGKGAKVIVYFNDTQVKTYPVNFNTGEVG